MPTWNGITFREFSPDGGGIRAAFAPDAARSTDLFDVDWAGSYGTPGNPGAIEKFVGFPSYNVSDGIPWVGRSTPMPHPRYANLYCGSVPSKQGLQLQGTMADGSPLYRDARLTMEFRSFLYDIVSDATITAAITANWIARANALPLEILPILGEFVPNEGEGLAWGPWYSHGEKPDIVAAAAPFLPQTVPSRFVTKTVRGSSRVLTIRRGLMKTVFGNTARPIGPETPFGNIDGTNKVFTLSSVPILGTLAVYVNQAGPKARPAFYDIAGNIITFVTAPANGSVITAVYGSAAGPVPESIFEGLPFSEGQASYTYTWHDVPALGVPIRAITQMLGTINTFPFDGYPNQTMLFESYNLIPGLSALGARIYQVQYNFIFCPKVDTNPNPAQNRGALGWNYTIYYVQNPSLQCSPGWIDAGSGLPVTTPVVTYVLPTSNGRYSGTRQYRLSDFRALFCPDQPS